MRRKERLTLSTDDDLVTSKPDEQVINDLIERRKLQQDALKKIIMYMDKSGHDEKSTRPKDSGQEDVKS